MFLKVNIRRYILYGLAHSSSWGRTRASAAMRDLLQASHACCPSFCPLAAFAPSWAC
jgi:hypothetical protein